MASENGDVFVKTLATFVRTHEKALANALQLRRRYSADHATSRPSTTNDSSHGSFFSSSHSVGVSNLAAALSFGGIHLSQTIKPAKLTLTPHHLFYLLSRFEELGVDVGPMNVRLENIHADATPGNYVSFLNAPPKARNKSKSGNDTDSIHSVSSMRSVMSNFSGFWPVIGYNSAARTERARAALETDIKYLYSSFTKIPCLRLSQDRRHRLIKGYEEFPFDTAVPLLVFKNVSALEIYDIDFRQFYGWDRVAEQVRSLTVKRANIGDPKELLVSVVIDDIERRRRRSSKPQSPPSPMWSASPSVKQAEDILGSSPGSPDTSSYSPRRSSAYLDREAENALSKRSSRRRNQSSSPNPTEERRGSIHNRRSKAAYEMRRSGSGSSESSVKSPSHRSPRNRSSSNLLSMGVLPLSKWRFLRHLSLADNDLTSVSSSSLSPLVDSLVSLDLSSNLFTNIPEGISTMNEMKALNLSNCLIESVASFGTSPPPVVESLNLRGNRLKSLMGLEGLRSATRIDLRDNLLSDPAELGRLVENTCIREIYVAGNPFTKSFPNYRTQILNIFRGSADRTEDIRIDGAGPSYTERKQLRDRAPRAEGPPVTQPQTISVSETIVQRHQASSQLQATPKTTVGPESVGATTPHQSPTKLSKRKPMQKKRIVDLTLDHNQNTRKADAITVKNVAQATTSDLLRSSEDEKSLVSKEHITSATAIAADTVAAARGPSESLSTSGLGLFEVGYLPRGDEYRKRAETMKHEQGADWLRILGEEARELHFRSSIPHVTTAQNSLVPRQNLAIGAQSLG